MLINPSKPSRKHGGMIFGQVESFHQFPDSNVFLCTQSRWLVLEVVHDQFQSASRFILSR